MTAPAVRSPRRWLWADQAALLLVAFGFTARLLAARRSFVLFDEALHARLASPDTILGVYRESLTLAHPPLFILLLHFWQRIVGPGWQLCLLPVAFGTAFLWVAYRWARLLFGTAAALATLALLAFLPQLVLLSAELRHYSLALCLVACALAALERGLRENSSRWLALSAASMALALGTHYLALRSAVALLAYGGGRLLASRPPRRLIRTWAACQVAVFALFAFLYSSHVSQLRGGGMEGEAQSDWLRASYFQPEDGALSFVLRQTAALFRFLFSTPVAGLVAAVLALAGIALLARRRRPTAILLAVPFVLAAAGGLLRLYPYGGTRHSIDLALYACAAIGISLARLSGDRPWVPLLLAAALAPAAFALGW